MAVSYFVCGFPGSGSAHAFGCCVNTCRTTHQTASLRLSTMNGIDTLHIEYCIAAKHDDNGWQLQLIARRNGQSADPSVGFLAGEMYFDPPKADVPHQPLALLMLPSACKNSWRHYTLGMLNAYHQVRVFDCFFCMMHRYSHAAERHNCSQWR